MDRQIRDRQIREKHASFLHARWIVLMLWGIFVFTACRNATQSEENAESSFFSPIIERSFDEAMGKSSSEYSFIFANSDDIARYTKIKAIYEKNLPSQVVSAPTVKIPKIIHQIWLGPNLPPAYFAAFQQKWRSVHPDWEYHLWSETELEKLELENWDLVEKSQNWAEKSDVVRCDLLDRFGGVYIDVDIDPLHSLNELHEKYDFYAGVEHPHRTHTTNNRVWVGISIIASRPGHPILKNWKRRIRSGWDEVDLRFSSAIERVVNHTYFPFTHAVMQEIDHPGNMDILFPATYFYPIAPNYASKRRSSFRSIRESIYDFLESIKLKKPKPFSRCYPETLAVHHWGSSWIPTPREQMKELERLIDAARNDLYKMQQRLRVLESQVSTHAQKFSQDFCNNTACSSECCGALKDPDTADQE